MTVVKTTYARGQALLESKGATGEVLEEMRAGYDISKTRLGGTGGTIVWWSAPTLVAVPAALAHSAASGTHLAKHLRAQPVEPLTAMRRALRRSHGGAHAATTAFWQELDTGTDEVLAAVYAIETGATVGDYKAEGTFGVVVTAKTGDVEIIGTPPDYDATRSLTGLLERYALERSALTAQDMAGAITACLLGDAKAVAVKAGGAVYWVAPDGVDVVESMRSTLAKLSAHGSPTLRCVNVSLDDVGDYIDDVRRHAMEEVDALRADIIKMTSLPAPRGVSRRAEALTARAALAQSICDRSFYLERILGHALIDVRDAARAAEIEVNRIAEDLRAAIVDGRIS